MIVRRAMTLVELVVSLGLLAILSLAMGSLVVVTSRAFPDPGTGSDTTRLSRAIEQFSADIALAIEVAARDATSITVTVPDRTGDGVADSIVYAWDGSAGDPLTRTINAGAAEVVAPDVASFALDSVGTTTTVSETVESADGVLISSEGTRAGSTGTPTLIWAGQYARPSIPAEATSWRITGVDIECASAGKVEGMGAVRIRPADGLGLPMNSILAESPFDETTLTNTFGWQRFLVPTPALSPGDGVCICVEWVSGTNPGSVAFATLIARADAFGLATMDGGGLWSPSPTWQMNFRLRGSYSTVVETSTTTLDRVNVTITSTNAADAPVRTSIALLNRPEV